MSGAHYYNEWDAYASQWLRNLIAAGHLPAGEVDERSITDVAADDLTGFRQCHFFAGIGGWALAARLAGWPEERELWTGSCPCQPFSVAGKGAGHADDRHLWPHQLRLLRARRPAVWMGEQVAAAVGKDWLDGVLADLEGIDYAGRAAVIPACAVDGPHRRDRLWIVAERDGAVGDGQRPRLEGHAGHSHAARGRSQSCGSVAEAGGGGAVGHADQLGASEERQQRGWQLGGAGVDSGACVGGAVGDADSSPAGRIAGGFLGTQGCAERSLRCQPDGSADAGAGRLLADADGIACGQGSALDRGRDTRGGALARSGLGSGDGGSAWAGAGWIIGHDGKARRVEPGIRLLAHGVPARVGRLRAYGNAIVPQVAAEVIAAYMECRP